MAQKPDQFKREQMETTYLNISINIKGEWMNEWMNEWNVLLS